MANGGNGVTKGGNLKRASLYDACQWVLKAWQEISSDTIVYAFKKCGISNALDGTEDDIFFETDDDSNITNSNIEDISKNTDFSDEKKNV